MSKVIVINDTDGHVNVIEWNAANAKALAEGVLSANEWNTILDDPDAIRDLLGRFDGSDAWLDEMEEIIDEQMGGRSNGNHVNVIDPSTDLTAGDVRGYLT